MAMRQKSCLDAGILTIVMSEKHLLRSTSMVYLPSLIDPAAFEMLVSEASRISVLRIEQIVCQFV